MFECAPKVISTEAAFFAKRLWIALTFQTDVRCSRWGERNWEHKNIINGLWNPFWQFYWNFSPRVQTSFNSNSKNFLRSHKFLIVLKTFLTNTAALLKCRKHERSFRRELRKKNLVTLEIKNVAKLFCNESSKVFLSRVQYGFRRHRLPLIWKKLKQLKKLFSTNTLPAF